MRVKTQATIEDLYKGVILQRRNRLCLDGACRLMIFLRKVPSPAGPSFSKAAAEITLMLISVEIIARRVTRFSREEAVYWLFRTTSFEPDANRWVIAGLRLMLGGQAHDPAVARMLQRLREST